MVWDVLPWNATYNRTSNRPDDAFIIEQESTSNSAGIDLLTIDKSQKVLVSPEQRGRRPAGSKQKRGMRMKRGLGSKPQS